MTSYALSLMVVVVDPQRLALVCHNNGGKQAGKPAGEKCYQGEHDENNVVRGGRMPLVLCLI